MENLSIQDIWRQNETILDTTRKLNLNLLKEIKLDQAKSSLRSLLFLPISTMIFFIIVAFYAMYFAVSYLDDWYFIFCGGIISFFSIWYVISSIRQLKNILSIDYSASIIQLQKDFTTIKLSILRNLRIAAYLLPFGPFVGVFVAKVIFNIDLMNLVKYDTITELSITFIALEIISFVILNALRPKNINKSWVKWLMIGSGSQVDEAITFLEDIQEFEQES
jgi:hypothetical protein